MSHDHNYYISKLKIELKLSFDIYIFDHCEVLT